MSTSGYLIIVQSHNNPAVDDEDEPKSLEEVIVEPEGLEDKYKLPPDIANLGYTHLDPKTLDKAL